MVWLQILSTLEHCVLWLISTTKFAVDELLPVSIAHMATPLQNYPLHHFTNVYRYSYKCSEMEEILLAASTANQV